MTFEEKYYSIANKNNSLLCIGLDSDHHRLPNTVENSQYKFNKAIIDSTHDLVCAYKPNSAFYEATGDIGIRELRDTCKYLNDNYSDIPIILDAKRADIANTNDGYIEYAFDYLGVDAICLQPYLGREALQPFLNHKDKGCIILCKTSNVGSDEIQNLQVEGEPLYKYLCKKVVNEWNINKNCMLVVGATYPEEMAGIREIAGDMTFLVPGIGAQGGDLEKTVKAGLNSKKAGMIINSSRGIIFASSAEDFAQKSREEATKLRDEINKYRL